MSFEMKNGNFLFDPILQILLLQFPSDQQKLVLGYQKPDGCQYKVLPDTATSIKLTYQTTDNQMIQKNLS